MNKLFLDPKQPLHTCKEEKCDGCPVSEKLVCHFNGKQLTWFLLLAFPIFGLGGYGIFTFNVWIFAAWIAMILLYFLLIEIRVMCSHCSHYAEPELTSLKCWANYGAPKLWKYRPGPMSFMEKFIFFAGLIIIFSAPAAAFGLQERFWFMGIYIFAVILGFAFLHIFLCKHCMNFACPMNAVKKKDREDFFDKNPGVKDAWEENDE
ncbi:MAG: hypothetical protein K9N05_00985 [Candidatus Marinimicrobia bacterium]|nr:hypothetical protein [Candidatus Neomarinimicrobiota bacterium]